MITEANFLRFDHIIMNEIVGSVGLAFFIAVVLIAYFSIKHKVPYKATAALIVMIGLGFVSYLYNLTILMMILFLVGIAFYGLYSKMLRR